MVFLNPPKSVSKYGIIETQTSSTFQFNQGTFEYKLELCHEEHHKPIFGFLSIQGKRSVCTIEWKFPCETKYTDWTSQPEILVLIQLPHRWLTLEESELIVPGLLKYDNNNKPTIKSY